MSATPTGPLARAAWLVVAVTVVRLVVAANLPLLEDEAYYWTWSTRLAAGYYDHPPAIAWIIAAGTAVFGKTALGVRSVGILLTGLGSVGLLPLARQRDRRGKSQHLDVEFGESQPQRRRLVGMIEDVLPHRYPADSLIQADGAPVDLDNVNDLRGRSTR